MLDIHTIASGRRLPVRGGEFCRIELAPLIDGNVHVRLTATTVDEDEPELCGRPVTASAGPFGLRCLEAVHSP